MHQTHQVVSLLFDGDLTAIFDAAKLPQFFVLPIYSKIVLYIIHLKLEIVLAIRDSKEENIYRETTRSGQWVN